jgi:hypothetical protein
VSAHEHALTLAASVAVAGGPRLRVAGPRAYFPGGDYVTVGPQGAVSSTRAGEPTFTEASLPARWKKGWKEGLRAYVETLSLSARQQNPVSVGTIKAAINLATKAAGRQKKPSVVSAKEYSRAVTIAEQELGVTADDAVYGCGDFGCAAPLSGRDDGILKVTTDIEEERAVAAVVRNQAYDGFAEIWRGPLPLPAAPGLLWQWYAYTREVVLVTERQMPYGTWNILRALDTARLAGDERAFLREQVKLRAFAKKHPSLLGIFRTLRALWRDGYMLGDFHSGNYGERNGVFVLFDAKATMRAPKPTRRKKNPTHGADLPPGVEDWFSEYADKGVPKKGEARYVETLQDVAPYALREVIAEALHAWRDPELGPAIHLALARDGHIEDYPGDMDEAPDWTADDLGLLIGVPNGDDALQIFASIVETLSGDPDLETGASGESVVPEFLEIALVGDALRMKDPERAKRPRLLLVSKEVAADFIAKHHQHYPEMKMQGLMYAIGVAVGRRLVSVATAGTPSGGFRSRSCGLDGILELSRIASDGTTRGASSMLAARLLDLFPKSGRRGLDGCLFVTYSLLSEAGTTYLALADKGIRPVGISAGKKEPTGARKGRGGGKPVPPKIIWEAGPDAKAPDWSVLTKTAAPPNEVEGAMESFYKWDARERKAGRGLSLSYGKKTP